MAFYLKYRPQKLADLDLAEVREGLTKALSSKEIPHAFLFTGPRGTGKTSAARIVAKVVNCEKNFTSQESRSLPRHLRGGRMDSSEVKTEPCNSCDSCLSITAGTNLDVLEIDAASNRGIDDIRNLREKIKLTPAKLKYKVYIIDEAHMLTSEAFNALLKTLEEPPKHAIFVLCTTAPEKLPQTVISRCLRFNFRRAKIDELVNGLEKIVKAEKLRVQKGVLEKIAQSADGSFRDSQKILEQLSFEEGEITVEKVNEVLGQVRGAGPEKLLGYLVDKDMRGAVLEIGRVVEKGVNLRWYSEQLLELLRVGLLEKIGVEIPDEHMSNTETLKLTKALKIREIKYLIEIFSRAAMELKTAIIPQLPLEMAVVEYCTKWEDGDGKLDKEMRSGKKKNLTSHFKNPASHFSHHTSIDFDSVCQKWPQVLKAVGPKNHSIQAFLRATRPKDFDGENLILEVFYEFHKSQLESDKCRRVVEETAELILKTPVKLKCILGKKPAPKPVQKIDEERHHLSLSSHPEVEDDIMKVAEEIFGKTAD